MGNSPSSDANNDEDQPYGSVYHSTLDFPNIPPVPGHRDVLSIPYPDESNMYRKNRKDHEADTFHPHSSRLSLQAEPDSPYHPPAKTKTLKVNDAIAILEELKKTATPEELVALQKALGQSSSEGHDESTGKNKAAPHRRRSFFGTANGSSRQSPPNVLKKTPPGKNSLRSKNDHQTWSPEMFGESPLARLANLEGGEIDRSGTPSDLDRSYLGTHKIGSLHVINGTASPAPSIYSRADRAKSNISLAKEDDYFTASESGRGSPEKQRREQLPSAHIDGHKTPTESYHNDQLVTVATPRDCDSPSHSSISSRKPLGPRNQNLMRRTTDESYFSQDVPAENEPTSTGQGMYQLEANSNPFLAESFEAADINLARNPSQGSTTSITPSFGRPSTRQQMYQSEATSNPFLPMEISQQDDLDPIDQAGPRPRSSPMPRPPAEQAGIDDTESVYSEHLTAVERQKSLRRWQPSPMISEGSVYSENPNQMHHQNSFRAQRRAADEPANMYDQDRAGYSHQSAADYRQPLIPPDNVDRLMRPKLKLDSAYHSESSLRTIKENPSYVTIPNPDHRREERRTTEGLHPVASLPNPTLPNVMEKALPPAPPIRSPIKLTGATLVPSAQDSLSNSSMSPNKSTSSMEMTRTPLTPGSASAPGTPKSPSSQPKTGPKKLQKKRPKPDRVQSSPVPNANEQSFNGVPLVPQDMVFKHAERLNHNPGMDHLEHTFKSISHAGDKESVKEDTNAVDIKFPSPNPSPEPGSGSRKDRKARGASLGPQPSLPALFPVRSRRSRDVSRENSASNSDEVLVGVQDFGTVAASLGSNPYDIATPVIPQTRRRPVPSSRPTHPHQISYGPGRRRSKSAVGMDERTASQFAMRKSRDRLANLDNHQPPLGRGMYNLPSDSMEVIPPRRNRRQTMYAEQPVVPPSSNERTSERPKSYHEGFGSKDYVFDRPAAWTPHRHERLVAQPNESHGVLREREVNSQQSLPPRGVVDDSAVDDSEIDWKKHAQAWRSRRKSIGENLGQVRPEWEDVVAVKPQPKRYRQSSKHEAKDVEKSSSAEQTISHHSEVPIQGPPRQPSPSILARAAIFDRPKYEATPPNAQAMQTNEFTAKNVSQSTPVSPRRSPDPAKKPLKSNLRNAPPRPSTPYRPAESDEAVSTSTNNVPLPGPPGKNGSWGLVDIPALMRQAS